LEIPINVAYNISGLQVYAGPYIGYAIGGKTIYDFTVSYEGGEMSVDEETTLVGVSDGYNPDDIGDNEMAVNMLDYGLNVGAGYKLGPAMISAQYGLGLGNLSVMPEGSDTDAGDYKATNKVISVSVSYFF